MAGFETWNRGVRPQGLIQQPQGVTLGEAIGAGSQALSQSLGQYARGMAENKVREEAKIEQARAKEDQREQQATTKSFFDFDASTDVRLAEMQQQAAPGAAGFVDAVKEDFDKRSAEWLKTVPASAQPYAQEQLARSWGITQGAALKYSATSRVQLDRKTAGDIIDAGGAILVTNPGKLDFVRDNVITSIKGMNLSPQEEAATLADVDAGLSTASLGGLVQRNPRQALASIDAGQWGVVGADKLLQLRGQAESKIKADAAMAQAEADRRQSLAQGDLLGRLDIALPAMQATGVIPVGSDGQPLVDPAEIPALVPGRRGDALARQFVTAQQEGQFRNSVASTNIADDYTRLAAMAPAPGQPWSSEQADLYRSAATVVSEKAKILAEDPASLVMGSPAIQQAWATRDSLAQTPNADPKLVAQATSSAINATVEAQVSLGAAPWQAKPLTKAQAQGLAGQIRTAGTAAQMQQVAASVVALGPQAVSQVLDAGAPPAFAAMTAITDPGTLNIYAQASNMKSSDVDTVLRSTGVSRSKIQAAVQEQLAPLFATMPAESRGLYQSAAEQAAIFALGTGAADETAAAKAVTAPLLAGVQIDGRLRVPAALDLGDVKAGLAQSMDDLLSGKAGIQVQPPPGYDSMGALREAARQGGLQWFMNEAGDGAILATPEGRWIPVVLRTSRDRATIGRYEVKFADAVRLGSVPAAPFQMGNPAGDQ